MTSACWSKPGALKVGALFVAMALASPLMAYAQPMMGASGAGMPNLRAISGKPLPDQGMPKGTVTVRLARKLPANAVTDTEITAIVEGPGGESRKRSAKTDAGGRAFFEALPAGHRFRAEVSVDGEKLSTESFPIPELGGIRVMLIAGLGAADDARAGAAPAKAGERPTDAPGTEETGGDEAAERFTMGIVTGSTQPDPSLPFGTIEIHAADEAGKAMAGKTVELGVVHKGGKVEVTRQVTNAEGVARFTGVTTAASAAEIGAAVVLRHGDMRLGTDPFGMPTDAGVKVQIRVPQRTSDPSTITVGAGGRLIVQVRDDSLSFIESLPLENLSDKIFDPGPGGIEIRLPSEAVNAEGAEGAHKIEVRKGIGVAVHGMIPPGRPQVDPNRKSPDQVTFGFVIPYHGSSHAFEQTFANGFGEFTFITEQIAGLTVDSAQISGRQERELGGKKYWLSRGEAIPPGGTLRFTLRGLPAPDTTGRTVAGVLALALVGAAIVFGRRPATSKAASAADERDKLVERREKLFSELVETESRPENARGNRSELMKKLENIYRDIAALDERRTV